MLLLNTTPRALPQQRSAARARRSPSLRVCALGFSDEPAERRPEKEADALLSHAASLLVLQPVLLADAGPAFIAFLTAVAEQRGELRTYGALYSKIASRGRSWAHVLTEAVLDSDTPFAAAAAASTLTPALRAAVASDLGALRLLSVPDATLALWAAQRVETSPAWRMAAAALRPPPLCAEEAAALTRLLAEPAPTACGPPATPAQRAAMLQILSSDWEGAASELADWHARFGFGLCASHADLEWRGGALTPLSVTAVTSACHAELTAADALAQLLAAHAASSADSARSCLLAGDSEVVAGALQRARAWAGCERLRFVRLARSGLGASLPALLAALRRQSATRFVVCCDPGLELAPQSEAHLELLGTLQARRRGRDAALPSNVMLVASSALPSGLKAGEAAVGASLQPWFDAVIEC